MSSLVAAATRSRPALLVVNKADRAPAAAASLAASVRARFACVLPTSAARSEGIGALEDAVAHALGVSGTPTEGAAWAANQRQACSLRRRIPAVLAAPDAARPQAEALELACAALVRLEDTVRADLPVDFWTIELREAALALGLVTGADVSDDVLGTIFARFCIGK